VVKEMLNRKQIKLVHVARKAAGLDEGRYRLLLRQYRDASGRPLESCRQMTNRQMDDFLAVCEAMGWRHPGMPEDYYRRRTAELYPTDDSPSFALREAMRHLAEDLGWGPEGLKKMIDRMTRARTDVVSQMTAREAWAAVEAMKSMLERRDKKTYRTLHEAAHAYSAREGDYEQTN